MLYTTYIWLICTIGAVIWFIALIHTLNQSNATTRKFRHLNLWPFNLITHTSQHITPSQTQPITPVKPSNLGKSIGVYSIQGQRGHMEDSYYANIDLPYFGVFDGHGGSRCSEFITTQLYTHIVKHNIYDGCESAIVQGFRQTDYDWLQLATHNSYDDGSTAICGIICNNILYVASCGDSRAVLCSNGRAIDMSVDHKPSRTDEKQRIESLGGRIIHYGTWRVEGVLAVTRSFGDRRLKKYVTAEPEIHTHQLTQNDDWLILATDGVWDVLSSQNVVDTAITCNDCKAAAELITMNAYRANSADNITCMVIDLRTLRH